MDNFKIDITGMKKVERNLMALGGDIAGKTLAAAVRDAAKPMHQAMLDKAPVGDFPLLVADIKTLNKRKKGKGLVLVEPGQLKSRVKIKSSKAVKKNSISKGAKKGEVVRVRVGVFRAYYAYFIEYGTKYMAAKPFIRPAIQSKSGLVTQIFTKRIKHRIELAQKRLARQAKKS